MCIVPYEVECNVPICHQEKFQSAPFTEMNSKLAMCKRTLSRNLQHLLCAVFVICTILVPPEALHATLMDRNRLVFTRFFSHLSNRAFVPKDWWAETALGSDALLVTGCSRWAKERRVWSSNFPWSIPYIRYHIHVYFFGGQFCFPSIMTIYSRERNCYGYEINLLFWESFCTRLKDKLWTLPVVGLVFFFKIIS
jgi:hypothetical protein